MTSHTFVGGATPADKTVLRSFGDGENGQRGSFFEFASRARRRRLRRGRREFHGLSGAILAQVGMRAPSLSFRCICHLGNHIKTRLESVACRLTIKCGKNGCTGSCPLSVVQYGYKAGKKPATCRTCGKTFPRPNVTLSDFRTCQR